MRELNDFERSVVKWINDNCKRGLKVLFNSIIIDMCLENKAVVIDVEKQHAELRVDSTSYSQQQLIKEIYASNYKIITTINVIKTLQENGYIISYFETPPINQKTITYSNLITGNVYYQAEIYDKDAINFLTEYNQKSIVGDTPLADFVERGFKSKEERTHQIEIQIAIAALILSTIIGIIELCHTSHEIHILEKSKWYLFQ